LSHHKLEEALREEREGCAVCRLVDKTGRRYIKGLLYEDGPLPERRVRLPGRVDGGRLLGVRRYPHAHYRAPLAHTAPNFVERR
jgi:hypothetical protein